MHNLGEAYGQLPSSWLDFKTPWAALDFDIACLYLGRQAEKNSLDGEKVTVETTGKTGFSSAKRLVTRKVKRKDDGTW